MNHNAISREELVAAAGKLVCTGGAEALSIRALAQACGISVGCVYNYFPSKGEILLAVAEGFWRDTFAGFMDPAWLAQVDYVSLVERCYSSLLEGLRGFADGFLDALSTLSREQRRTGRELEATAFLHMKHSFLVVLRGDAAVASGVWNEQISPEGLVDFTFDAMLAALRADRADCAMLLELLRRTLYERKELCL